MSPQQDLGSAGCAVNVIGYVRVSTDEQADSGAGLLAQRAAMTEECRRRGWSLVAIHADTAFVLHSSRWRNVSAQPLNAGYVGFHRKRGGTELREAAFAGFMTLETFQALQETRRGRTRTAGHPSRYEVYVLSGSTCGSCGGKVTAARRLLGAVDVNPQGRRDNR